MQCTHKKADGSRCGANAITGKRKCFFHSAEKRADHMDAVKKGGENRKKLAGIEGDPLAIQDAEGARQAASKILDKVWSGQLDYRIGNALSGLLNTFKGLHDAAVFERKLEEQDKMLVEIQQRWRAKEVVVETGKQAEKKPKAKRAGSENRSAKGA